MSRNHPQNRRDLSTADPLYEKDEDEEAEIIQEDDDHEMSPQKRYSEGGRTWTMEEYSVKEQRPGPQPLSGRRKAQSPHQLSPSTSTPSAGSFSDSSKTPAAGKGTRMTPRPIPRSSSSLRHISSKPRSATFAIVPEDVDLNVEQSGDFRTVQNSLEAAKRRLDQERAHDDFLGDESDEDDEGEDGPSVSPDEAPSWTKESIRKRRAKSDSSKRVDESRTHLAGYVSSSDDDEDEEEMLTDSLTQLPTQESEAFSRRSSDGEAQDWAERQRALRFAEVEPGGPSAQGPRRAPWHPKGPSYAPGDSPPLLQSSTGLMTPGPNFCQSLHTPIRTSDVDPILTIEPRQRLEWHTMLQSVLRSEVLQSETKRITSADAPTLTKRELMYQRWLDIRASLRGRGHLPGAIEAEERRLKEGWPLLIEQIINKTQQCRSNKEHHFDISKIELDNASIALDDKSGIKESVIAEVGDLLQEIDDAEDHFPSYEKLLEIVPAWDEPSLRNKREVLYAWYNIITSLRMQLEILQKWTGSKTLEVNGQQDSASQDPVEAALHAQPHAEFATAVGGVIAPREVEASTFLERMLKEDPLQKTFEERTLESINKVTDKAKKALIEYHKQFDDLCLPSFEPELRHLINFPTRLMEGALKLRLDYAGNLKDPSVLIVDSLTDDLRAAIALACRIKLQYKRLIAPDVENGWNITPCIGTGYDPTLREALRFFFKLLSYKLKGSIFFKETEFLDPEWNFLGTAIEAIEGGDVIVAISITRFVNKLFKRIVAYFERELSAPSSRRNIVDEMAAPIGGSSDPPRDKFGPAGSRTAVSLMAAKGKTKMTLDEKVRWIHGIFNNVRIRSRKLLGFAREVRNRLENAAEYDLGSLNSHTHTTSPDLDETQESVSDTGDKKDGKMDLTEFMQTLIDAGYFLVLTGSFEAEGIYLIAEPSLSDKPEKIQEIFCKCLLRVDLPNDEENMVVQDNGNPQAALATQTALDTELKDDHISETGSNLDAEAAINSEEERPKYLLVLSPREAFLWTGRIMSLELPRIDVDLKERRLRLIADGTHRRLLRCQKHLYSIFKATEAQSKQEEGEVEAVGAASRSRAKRGMATAAASSHSAAVNSAAEQSKEAQFPLEIVTNRLAHISAVQAELRKVNHGVYMLSDAIIRAVPKIRRHLRGRRILHSHPTGVSPSDQDKRRGIGMSGDTDELIQNCFSMASEQGFRALPFIESTRLQEQMTLALATLAIDWVAFICDDCEPSDRKTFKYAVAALENAQHVTKQGGILNISEDDFVLMRAKVASCVGLLISHFDILGARSSVAKAKEEEERLEREKAERLKAIENAARGEFTEQAVKEVEGCGTAGAPPMLGRADSGMQATEERWVSKVLEWDAARQSIEGEQRLIGRVLDDTRLEDRGLQFLASSSSRIQIRWQQGRFIGGGTFGTVYLAVNLDSGGLMAVKEIRFQDISSTPGMYKQIKDEMSVMEMLSHPNIVEYYGIEVHRDKVYIFEEYCQGGSLAQLLEHGRIEDEAVIQVYTLQMLDGLVYLHSKGVVHRDIKPDNILLDHMGVIKFVDFGAAKVLAKNSRTVQRSRRPGSTGGNVLAGGGLIGPDGKPAAAASLQGTPMYMSPEVIKGESRGRRGAMDVWSLGCVVLEFATGRRPWSQLDNEWAIMFHIGMAQQHPPLPEPGQLSELGIEFIRSCLVIDPYDRPSAIELREHPWIQSLIEELNQANEEENSQQQEGITSSTTTGEAFMHGTESAAGVAAMAATPGLASINGFNFQRPPAVPSFGHNSSFSKYSTAESSGSNSNVNTPMTLPASHAPTPNLKANATIHEGAIHHDPGHPNHAHPGYQALVADLAYSQEQKQAQAMIQSDSFDPESEAD